MLKTSFAYFAILISITSYSTAYCQKRDIQLNAGVQIGFSPGTHIGTNFQIKRYFDFSRFRVSANYHYTYINGESTFTQNGQLVQVTPVIAHKNVISTLAEYQIYKSKKDHHRGVSIGLGPGYNFSTKNGKEYLTGPGIAIKLEYQGGIKGGWYWGYEMFGIYYWSQLPDRVGDDSLHGKLNDMPFILKVGFLPGMNKR